MREKPSIFGPVTVRCNKRKHRVMVVGGKFVLLDHPDPKADKVMVELGGEIPCYELRKHWALCVRESVPTSVELAGYAVSNAGRRMLLNAAVEAENAFRAPERVVEQEYMKRIDKPLPESTVDLDWSSGDHASADACRNRHALITHRVGMRVLGECLSKKYVTPSGKWESFYSTKAHKSPNFVVFTSRTRKGQMVQLNVRESSKTLTIRVWLGWWAMVHRMGLSVVEGRFVLDVEKGILSVLDFDLTVRQAQLVRGRLRLLPRRRADGKSSLLGGLEGRSEEVDTPKAATG